MKIYRIIDANINRLMEGLRVIEEIPRFILDDNKLTQKFKELRIKIKNASNSLDLGDDNIIETRNSKEDVGRDLYPKSESLRTNINQIITSNFKRCEESSRVLEEFGKMINPEIGRTFKQIRYALYCLEKELFKNGKLLDLKRKLDFDLYVITDPDVLSGRSPIDAVKGAIEGGCKIIQLRDKKTSIGQYYKWAKEISSICKKAGVTFIVNDYIDICLAVDADGVHIGQDDVPVSVARKLLGETKIIGLSTHNFEQAEAGAKSGADYISIGPIFLTQSKPNTKPLGLEFIRKISAASEIIIPFVAIGGINENNLNDVIKAGAKRAAVIRAAIADKNIPLSVKKLRRLFQ